MLFSTVTPEQAGISSLAVEKFLKVLEDAALSTHSIVMARGNHVFFEKYYPPFHKDFLHREYSDTKSLVALAVGFAQQDGLVDLSAPIETYFPIECSQLKDPAMGKQTVRHMLMMSTPKHSINWFAQRSHDRVLDYFTKTTTAAPIGSGFDYDSTGSFILATMVERVTGKLFMDYLREKLFDKIGVSKEAHCLMAPGGHSWGDSAALMKPMDMVKIIRFILDGGSVNGEQLLNEDYLKTATSLLISTEDRQTKFSSFGYGYQIWRTYDDSFFFNGMGSQYAVGVPDKDLIFVINSDNQGIPDAGDIIMKSFFELISRPAEDVIPDDPTAKEQLDAYAASLVLSCEKGAKTSPLVSKIAGKRYQLDENPLGITSLRFSFGDDCGILEYTNAQGTKNLLFGLCENRLTVFPEEGYSREVGSVFVPGNYYRCAASAAWKSDTVLRLNVQIIDEYLGRLWMDFSFDEDRMTLNAQKVAENFLSTYQGRAQGVWNERH